MVLHKGLIVLQWKLLTRTASGPAILRGYPLSEVTVHIECVYKSTFGLSFVGRFVLFWSVLYRR